MTEKMKIKIIKKGAVSQPTEAPVSEKKAKRAAAREIVSNVSNWVNDFQQQKRESTKLAIEQLFGQQARPTEL